MYNRQFPPHSLNVWHIFGPSHVSFLTLGLMLCTVCAHCILWSDFGVGLQSPIISIEPHSAAVKQGESASFRCRVHSGAQPVRLEWKPTNNQPLPGTLLQFTVMSV